MATIAMASQYRVENAGQLREELELLSQALDRRTDEKSKTLPGRGGVPAGKGEVSKFSASCVTLNFQFPLPNIGFRHSTTCATSHILEQHETCSQLGLSWTRGRRAGKSVNVDRKSDTNATDLWNSPQLQHSHSSMGHKNASNIENFPDWLEDNLNFSRQIEVLIKKKRLWDSRCFRALARIGQKRFSCKFSMQVHRIEGLLQSMNGSRVSVCWRRRDREVQTKPATVSQGTVEFEETLHHTSTIYGNKNPDQCMHYRSKIFTLFVTALDAEGLDFGKHRLDLSKLLPEYLVDDRENAKPRSWTTSFKLAGKAKGGTLSVTFRYMILNKEPWQLQRKNAGDVDFHDRLSKQSRTPPICALEGHISPSISEPGANHEYITDLSLEDPVNEISSKTSKQVQLSEGVKGSSLASLFALEAKISLIPPASHQAQSSGISSDGACKNDDNVVSLEDDIEFTVVEKGVEMSCGSLSELLDGNKSCEVNSLTSREEEGRIENGTSVSQVRQSDSLYPRLEKNGDAQVSHEHEQERHNNLGKVSTKDDDDLVESEFLSMLNKGHNLFCLGSVRETDSTRACLCHQFERGSFPEVGSRGHGHCVPSLSSFTQTSRHSNGSDEDLKLVSLVLAAESELKAMQTTRSKIRARILDDAEAEALMLKWGLEEKDFNNSPPDASGAFGSPINSPVPGSVHLPALADGLGSVVWMKEGGLVRQMNPMLSDTRKNNGRLIMQVSKPLAMPVETDLSAIDILHSLASLGAEKLSLQAEAMMPLEDITGKALQQVALEAGSGLDISKSRNLIGRDIRLNCRSDQLPIGKRMIISEGTKQVRFGTQRLKASVIKDSYNEFASLEELVLSAMEKIEALAVEGLKIQSDMTEQDAPSSVNVLQSEEMISFVHTRANKSCTLGLEETVGLQSLDANGCNDNVDGLMAMAITLEEWMQLDSGLADEDANERTSKILAAHTDVQSELIYIRHPEDDKVDIGNGKRGFMGNTLTMAFRFQLHDALWNHEPVGAPMIALVQAERCVSHKVNNGVPEETKDRNEVPSQFKVTDVHVAGLQLQENTKLKGVNTPKKQHSGSRWLIANGMGKMQKHVLQKLRRMPTPMPPSKTEVKPGDTLWSISAHVHGSGNRWTEIAALNPHIRNPNIIFADQTINLR
jgi:hypothetical protein